MKNDSTNNHSLAPPTKIQESVQELSNDGSHLRRFSPSTEINIDNDEALTEPKFKKQCCTVTNIAEFVADSLAEIIDRIVAAEMKSISDEFALSKKEEDNVRFLIIGPESIVSSCDNKLDPAGEKSVKVEIHHDIDDKESSPIFGADLISVQLETSLVHISSHIETTLLRHTFIGSSNSSDESIVNVEYQGDNVVGFFDHNCNHTLKFGHNTRRLHGPVYMVRRYQSSLDEEMVYAVIIWTDAVVKDKIEIEIMAFDDYFELMQKT